MGQRAVQAGASDDHETQRAYVELRGKILTVAVFSFQTTAGLPRRQIEQDIVRKARHLFKKAALGLDDA